MTYRCDYWLPERRKCASNAKVEAQDRYGAPLRFCRRHWPVVQQTDQYAKPLRELVA